MTMIEVNPWGLAAAITWWSIVCFTIGRGWDGWRADSNEEILRERVNQWYQEHGEQLREMWRKDEARRNAEVNK